MADLRGRIALVTGAGRGVGRSIALGLAADGADVAVNYRRDDAAAAATVAEIEELGRRAIAVRASVNDPDADADMVDRVAGELGPISILVNNAGQASRGNSVVETDPTEVERLLGTHAVGAHHLCRLVLPHMRPCDRGDVVFISSVATDRMAANGAPYNMAKAAVEALARTLAQEEQRNGVRVNIVAPAWSRPRWAAASSRQAASMTSPRSTRPSRSVGSASPRTSLPWSASS